MDSLAAIAPHSAVLFTALFGLSIGASIFVMELTAVFLQRKLRLKESENLKYFFLIAAVAASVALFYCAVVTLFWPSYIGRVANFDRNLEALGYPVFFLVSTLSVFIVALPAQFVAVRIKQRADAESEAAD